MTSCVAPQPKHKVIFEHLHQAIKRGEFKDGARLPSEKALARHFGVSRPTVAKRCGNCSGSIW